jgi:hypothetical protein
LLDASTPREPGRDTDDVVEDEEFCFFTTKDEELRYVKTKLVSRRPIDLENYLEKRARESNNIKDGHREASS